MQKKKKKTKEKPIIPVSKRKRIPKNTGIKIDMSTMFPVEGTQQVYTFRRIP